VTLSDHLTINFTVVQTAFVAVPSGSPQLRIASVKDLRHALLTARAIIGGARTTRGAQNLPRKVQGFHNGPGAKNMRCSINVTASRKGET
jgi:hypothetical protein